MAEDGFYQWSLHCAVGIVIRRLMVFLLTGSTGDESIGGRLRKLSLGQYDNDAVTQVSFSKCGWGKAGVDPAPSLGPFSSPADIKEVCFGPVPISAQPHFPVLGLRAMAMPGPCIRPPGTVTSLSSTLLLVP